MGHCRDNLDKVLPTTKVFTAPAKKKVKELSPYYLAPHSDNPAGPSCLTVRCMVMYWGACAGSTDRSAWAELFRSLNAAQDVKQGVASFLLDGGGSVRSPRTRWLSVAIL